MLVTLLGIVMLVRPEQSLNVESPMLVTLLGIVILPDFPAGQQINLVPSFEYKMPSILLYAVLAASTVIDVRLEQLSNAACPILVTLLGIVMPVRLVQYSNAATPILVTLLGIVMPVRL